MEINQRRIFKISLIISLIGILFLLLLINILEPKLIPIEKIKNNILNKNIKIQGEISNIEDKETFKILSIQDETGKIDVICNSGDFEENQKIIVSGRVKEYQQYLNIQANKIIQQN